MKSQKLRKSLPKPTRLKSPEDRPLYMSADHFQKVKRLQSRFNDLFSEPTAPSKVSSLDEQDFTAGIKPKKRPMPPWLAKKIGIESEGSDDENGD